MLSYTSSPICSLRGRPCSWWGHTHLRILHWHRQLPHLSSRQPRPPPSRARRASCGLSLTVAIRCKGARFWNAAASSVALASPYAASSTGCTRDRRVADKPALPAPPPPLGGSLLPLVASLQLARVSGASLALPRHLDILSTPGDQIAASLRVASSEKSSWIFGAGNLFREGFGDTAKKTRERVILRSLDSAVWQNLSFSVYCTSLLFCVCYFFL